MWQKFGQRVRERRDELGLTQEGAGKRAGMKRQQWNRIEQGASTKRPTLLRIAKALELEPAIVLDWAGFKLEPQGAKHAHSGKVEEVLDDARFFERKGLSEDGIAELRPYLEMLDREVDRVQEKELRHVRLESVEDVKKLADELNDGQPLVKKIKKSPN